MNMNLGKLWEMVRDKEAWHIAAHWVAKSDLVTEQEQIDINAVLVSDAQHNDSAFIYIVKGSPQ